MDVYVGLHVCLCITCIPGSHRGQERALDALGTTVTDSCDYVELGPLDEQAVTSPNLNHLPAPLLTFLSVVFFFSSFLNFYCFLQFHKNYRKYMKTYFTCASNADLFIFISIKNHI